MFKDYTKIFWNYLTKKLKENTLVHRNAQSIWSIETRVENRSKSRRKIENPDMKENNQQAKETYKIKEST